MSKIYKVDSCSDCPEVSFRDYEEPYCSEAEQHFIDYDGKIPKWCPLPDASITPVQGDGKCRHVFEEVEEDLLVCKHCGMSRG